MAAGLCRPLCNSFPPGFTQGNKKGVTCEAGNAHSSRAPDFTLQWTVHVLPVLFMDFVNVWIK